MLAVLALLLAALLFWRVLHKNPAPPPKHASAPVSAAVTTLGDVDETVTAIATAQAWNSVKIVPQVSGVIRKVNFTEGSMVKAGQVLAEIDPAPYRAALTQAEGALARDEAQLAGARVDLARYKMMADQEAIARQTYDDQAALVHQYEGVVLLDKGAVAAARVNLGWCRIVSPIAGRAGVRNIDPGNYVAPAGAGSTTSGTGGATTSPTGIVTINQIEPVAVTFSVPQPDYQRMREASGGFARALSLKALSQETGAVIASGELSIADNQVDVATGTVKMKGRFANAGEPLLPGQFVNVALSLGVQRNVVTVPLRAVNHGPNGAFAYVIGPDDKVSMRPLTTGAAQGAIVVVQSGLKPGEMVVTDGQVALDNGVQVRVVAPPKATGAGAALNTARAPAQRSAP